MDGARSVTKIKPFQKPSHVNKQARSVIALRSCFNRIKISCQPLEFQFFFFYAALTGHQGPIASGNRKLRKLKLNCEWGGDQPLLAIVNVNDVKCLRGEDERLHDQLGH